MPSPAHQPLIADLVRACGVEDEHEVEEWLSTLRRVRASSDRRTTRTAAPYLGLSSFEPEDFALFFGRGEQTQEILDRLRTLHEQPGPSAGILAVIGPSGSGKSSLLRAGVVAAVRAGALDTEQARWTCRITTPGSDPAAALGRVLAEAPDGTDHRVVVIDQFEEVFTSVPDQADRTRFLTALQGRDPGVLVIIGMRADFYAEAAREPLLLAALRHAQVLVGPMTQDQVRDAIIAPAEQLGASVEDGLVDLVLADLLPHDSDRSSGRAYDAGALPLLSHALLSAWERSSGRRLTVADYRSTGGLDAAVQHTAEDVYTRLDPAQQDVARHLFLRLVNVDGEVAVTRRRISRTELADTTGSSPVDEIADRFVERRLLTASATSIEISHEALLSAWPRLHGWIDADRVGLLQHRRLTTAANVWADGLRDPALLLTAGRLEGVREWAEDVDHRLLMNETEHDFLAAGLLRRDTEARAERTRTRRLQQLLAAVAVLALVATGLAIWARTAQTSADAARSSANRSRDDALSGRVADQARQLDHADPALAQQLALAAYGIAPTAVARAAVIDESAGPVITRILGPLGPTPLAVDGARRLIAVGHADGTVHLFSESAGRPPAPLSTLPAQDGRQALYALAFSPDRAILAVGGEPADVRLWNLADPRHPTLDAAVDPHFGGAAETLAFNPDGRTLLAGSEGASPLQRWDVSTPAHPVLLAPAAGVPAAVTVNSVAFNTGGSEFAMAGNDSTVLVWDTPSAVRTAPRRLDTGTASVATVAFVARSHEILVGTRTGAVQVWSDTAAPRLVQTLANATNAQPTGIAVSADGRTVAIGYSDGILRQWDVATWEQLSTVDNPGPVTGVAYSGDSGTVLSTAADGTLRLEPAGARSIGVTGTVFGLAYTADGGELAVGDNGSSPGVRLWDVHSRTQPTPLTPLLSMTAGAGPSDGTAAVRADGSLVATGNRSGMVELWDTGDPAHVTVARAPFAASTALVESVAFSPDGRLLAVAADDGKVALWDVSTPSTPRLVARLAGASLMLNAAFSPNGRLLAGASADDSAYLWDVSDPAHVRRVSRLTGFRSYVYGVAFSHDSTLLAATSSDHTTRVWDLHSPSRPVARGGPYIGPTGYVLSAAFAPDGQRLAVGSDDRTVRIYDLHSTQRVPEQTLTGFDGEVWALAFDPSGQTLVAAGRAPSVVFFSTDARGYEQRLCPLAGDPITRQEWSLYVPGTPYDPPCS